MGSSRQTILCIKKGGEHVEVEKKKGDLQVEKKAPENDRGEKGENKNKQRNGIRRLH